MPIFFSISPIRYFYITKLRDNYVSSTLQPINVAFTLLEVTLFILMPSLKSPKFVFATPFKLISKVHDKVP